MRQLMLILFLIGTITVQNYANPESPFKKQPEAVYVIQLGAFSSPKVSDFQKLKKVGYLYTESIGKIHRVLLGRFENPTLAKSVLAEVKALGFKDAFVSNRKIDAGNMAYGVQVQSYNKGERIEWEKWRVFKSVYVYLTADDKVKVLIGSYNDLKTANLNLQTVREKGHERAYIKHINRGLIHKTSPFEMAVNTSKASKPKIEPIVVKPVIRPEIKPEPQVSNDKDISYIGNKGGDILIVKPTDIPVSYDEFNDKPRKSVKQLQTLLADNSNFTGDVNGVYSRNTEDALKMFEVKNDRYNQYKLIAQNKKEEGVKGGIQSYVNMIYENPFLAYGGLKSEGHPMADVYLAYMYYTGKANPKEQNKQQLIDALMNGAIQKVFVTGSYKGTTGLDFNKQYHYDNILLIIEHLSYMQDAMQDPPALPCWLFENHPKEAASMFNKLYSMASGCGDFMEWEELKVLKTIAEDLDHTNHAALGKGDENIRLAYDSRRAQLYLAPTISADEASVIETWNDRLWSALNKWSDSDPLHKKMVTPLEIAYYQALVKLENHYLGRGFNEKEAQVLGLSVLRTVVNYHLNTYVR